MTDTAHIPQLLRVADTSELPVEVETPHELRIWHDEAGAWCDTLASTALQARKTPGGWLVCASPASPPHAATMPVRSGTIRICELVPVGAYERDGKG